MSLKFQVISIIVFIIIFIAAMRYLYWKATKNNPIDEKILKKVLDVCRFCTQNGFSVLDYDWSSADITYQQFTDMIKLLLNPLALKDSVLLEERIKKIQSNSGGYIRLDFNQQSKEFSIWIRCRISVYRQILLSRKYPFFRIGEGIKI